MPFLLKESDFRGAINVPGTERPEVCGELERFIERHEPQFMDYALGVGFANTFYAGALPSNPDARWVTLVNGGSWTDTSSGATITRRFLGLKWLAARYVYFYWQRNLERTTTPSGVKKTNSENASNVSPFWNQKNAWDEMIREMHNLWHFLKHYQISGATAYPEFISAQVCYSKFRPLPVF